VSDEEDGRARTGMEWLVTVLPELRVDHAINEGGGTRLELADGRVVHCVSIGEKGTYPARVTARGEAGHASMPTIGRNAVPRLGRLLGRLGDGLPAAGVPEVSRPFFAALLGETTVARALADDADDGELAALVARAAALHPTLRHVVPALTGTTTAPTMLAAGVRLNVMPARAHMDVDCRVLPEASPEEVEAELRARLGNGGPDEVPYDLEWIDRFTPGTASPAQGPVDAAIQAWLDAVDPGTRVLPTLCTGFTDSTYLRAAFGTAAYGYSPYLSTPADVVDGTVHNADERVHVDDLARSVTFHEHLARSLCGG
jgi:acetylornithine deacetylase/succinyl-diaminopimelate desuccinylase-like protein